MTRRELSECLVEDRKRTLGNTRLYHIIFIALTQHAAWVRWKYVKFMRKAAFYESKFLDGRHLYGFPMIWYVHGLFHSEAAQKSCRLCARIWGVENVYFKESY